MAVGPGPLAAFGRGVDIGVRSASNSDGYDSGAGFSVERGQATREAARSLAEEERNPELSSEIIDETDADAVLLQQILADRRGLRGVWNRFKNSRITRGAITCLKWGAAAAGVGLVAGAVAGGGLALVAPGAMIAGAVEGGAVGAAIGAFTGKMAGKARQENAATWMSDLKILRSTHAELGRTNEGELLVALGVMRNAIMDRKVRGTDATRMEMVLKYRQIKQILATRREEARAEGLEGEDMNPAIRAIDEALQESNGELQAISDMAGETYKEAYDTLVEDKNAIVRAFIRKNALKRGAFGAVFGALAPMVHAAFAGPDSAVSTVGQGTALGSESANAVAGGSHAAATGAHVAGESAAMAKMHALQGTDHIVQETATHATNMNDYMAGMHGNTMAFPPGTDMAIMDHLARLENAVNTASTHGSLAGLHGGDLASFGSVLHGGMSNLHQVSDFLWHHNIDSTFSINGQPFAEFLATNQSTFLGFPDVVQSFILSHPSIAPDLFALAQHGTPAAASALVTKLFEAAAMATPFIVAAAPSAALGGVAAGMTPRSLNVKDELYQDKNKYISDVRKEANKEVTETNADILKRRQEALKTRLIGARVELNSTTVMAGMFAAAATAGIAPRPDQLFDIANIDGDGNIIFVNRNTDWDRNLRARRVNPYPSINLRQITNDDRTDLDPARAIFIMSAPEVDNDRVIEAEDEAEATTAEAAREGSLAELRTILTNQEVILTDGFINSSAVRGDPVDKAAWVVNPRFQILNIADGLDGQINFAPRTGATGAAAIPIITMKSIVQALPSGDKYRLRFDRIQPVNTLPTITPSVPGAPAAPTAPAAPAAPTAPAGPDRSVLEGEFITGKGREQEGRVVDIGGKKFFRVAAPVPALNNSVDFPLDSTVNLPAGTSDLRGLRIRFNEVKITGGNPTFSGDVFFTANDSGTQVNYVPEQKFEAAPPAKGTNPKTNYLDTLRTIATATGVNAGIAHAQMIYSRLLDPNHYLRFEYAEPAAGGATATPEKYHFTEFELDGAIVSGTDHIIERSLLDTNAFVRLQQDNI